MEPRIKTDSLSPQEIATTKALPLAVADALAAGVPSWVIARALRRSETWVRWHADLLRPGVRALFATGRITTITAYACFRRLAAPVRRTLLDEGGRITVMRCTRAPLAGNIDGLGSDGEGCP